VLDVGAFRKPYTPMLLSTMRTATRVVRLSRSDAAPHLRPSHATADSLPISNATPKQMIAHNAPAKNSRQSADTEGGRGPVRRTSRGDPGAHTAVARLRRGCGVSCGAGTTDRWTGPDPWPGTTEWCGAEHRKSAMSTTKRFSKSQRDGHVFITAFGMMDSDHEGEATAAFLQARKILRGRGETFRAFLERLERAERLNRELAMQNAAVLRETAIRRARDSRSLAATVLLIAACKYLFIVGRLVAGIAAGLVALGFFVFGQDGSPNARRAAHASGGSAAYASVAPVSRPAAPATSSRGMDCGAYRVMPGYSCPGWRRSWSEDSYRGYSRYYDRRPAPPRYYRPYWIADRWWLQTRGGYRPGW